jgi:hypothetical protein
MYAGKRRLTLCVNSEFYTTRVLIRLQLSTFIPASGILLDPDFFFVTPLNSFILYFAAPEIFTRRQRRGAGDCLDRRFFDPGTIHENM